MVETGLMIQDQVICLEVPTKVVTTITRSSLFKCGISAQLRKFGSALGVATGSMNCGVIGPEPVHADTGVWLKAVGGAFTGGAVRVGYISFVLILNKHPTSPATSLPSPQYNLTPYWSSHARNPLSWA